MRSFLRHYFLNGIGRFLQPVPAIHLINSHYVTPTAHVLDRDREIFRNYMNYLSLCGEFMELGYAVKKILDSSLSPAQPHFVFTFDDGFEECYTTIAPILEEFGTRGAFFINANYIDAGELYRSNFNNRVNTYTKKPMTWLQVKDLHERGHVIGSHGLDHLDFSLLTVEDIDSQISDNKRALEQALSYQCDHFAWTYGQMRHFPRHALEIAKKYHTFVYSATNYRNYFSCDRSVINRRHLEPFWPNNHLRYFLSKKKYV
jgi:peptidoglycan/xylan/chitin deacetylase (PgdA/CDA1 family)